MSGRVVAVGVVGGHPGQLLVGRQRILGHRGAGGGVVAPVLVILGVAVGVIVVLRLETPRLLRLVLEVGRHQFVVGGRRRVSRIAANRLLRLIVGRPGRSAPGGGGRGRGARGGALAARQVQVQLGRLRKGAVVRDCVQLAHVDAAEVDLLLLRLLVRVLLTG